MFSPATLRVIIHLPLLACVCLQDAVAEGNPNWTVRAWRTRDGLPNERITGISQAPDGHLLIATPGGLCRFDGVHFDKCDLNSVVPASTLVENVRYDRKGNLWLATNRGQVIHIRQGSAEVVGQPPNGTGKGTPKLIHDSAGNTWLLFKVDLFAVQNGKLAPARTPEGNPLTDVESFTCDKQGNRWFIVHRQLYRWNGDRLDFIVQIPEGPARLAPAKDGGLWICTKRLIFRWDGNRLIQCRSDLTMDGAPTDVLADRNGGLWIATIRHGLYYFDGDRLESIQLSDRAVLTLAEDREGNIWAGTVSGLNRIRPRAITTEYTEALPLDYLQSVCEDANGILWAATSNGRLVCRRDGQWTTEVPEPLRSIRATCVTSAPDGSLWIGTMKYSLHQWRNGELQTWDYDDGLTEHTVRALLVSTQGEVWFSTEAANCVFVLRNGKLIRPLPRGTPRILALTEDATGNLWLGGYHGVLFRVTHGVISDETTRTDGETIRSLFCASDNLWIGYERGGIGRLNPTGLLRIRPEHGLPDYPVSQIIDDVEGNLWFGTDYGIYRIRLGEFDKFIAGHTSRVTAIWQQEGCSIAPALYSRWPAAFRNRKGRLWMPTRDGLVSVDPAKLCESGELPVLVKRITVDETPVAMYESPIPTRQMFDLSSVSKLKVGPEHRRLQIDYTALNLAAPGNVQYRYKMEGLDENWIDAGGQRTASYSRLNAGDFRFRVQACADGRAWHESSLDLTVTPFIWQTWWFRLSALVLFTTSVIVTVRAVSFHQLQRKLRAAEHEAALEKERARIAKDIHDDAGGSLTRILLLTELARRDGAEERLREISGTTRQVMKSLDETVWALNPQCDRLSDLITYISQYALDFLASAEVRCWIDVPEEPPGRNVPAEIRHNLFLATKEALHNVVKHSGADEVQLCIRSNEAELTISVSDNGCGCSEVTEEYGSDGLGNMRQRLAEIGGSFQILTQPGAGTQVTLTIPWKACARRMSRPATILSK